VKYVFGPVPSRRLGRSLGIDPIPLKTCNWNCVYCQLGRTRPLTNTRREYFPHQDILVEVQQALKEYQPGEIDWLTFVGSGEPTLHSQLGWLIQQVKNITDLPIAVITNGALLYLPKVRIELAAADAVLPSLDAGNARLYRKINRPWPKLTLERLVSGLATFRRGYHGRLWIEIMLLRDLNDNVEALQEIADILKRIQPDQVHLLLPVRPPAESWVQPADETGLQRAQAILGEVARVVLPNIRQVVTYSTDDLESAILGIITRHPMEENELSSALGHWSLDEVQQVLGILLSSGKAKQVIRHGKQFWSVTRAYFATDDSEARERV
jgi:wyosine [tRNA(Phe)-imidazoG37] synthetase (radical SAM superfamily)